MDNGTWITLRTLISKQLHIHREHVKQHMNLYDDLGADNLDIINLFIRVENSFNIEMPENRRNSFSGDISLIVNFINESLSAQ
jgi:acyl carrier protein